jgi:hypothetical protein
MSFVLTLQKGLRNFCKAVLNPDPNENFINKALVSQLCVDTAVSSLPCISP